MNDTAVNFNLRLIDNKVIKKQKKNKKITDCECVQVLSVIKSPWGNYLDATGSVEFRVTNEFITGTTHC